ncbi:hypothetical protein [Clostridium magnum]|uniref:Uncharacterized protein n=1 Tax=Clostridium magnum DSM 2767 TaxID=1121326 RepID=A0A162SVJ3_9CLOT|nr:hypothetical protein [Clostridium magnum]KZL91917.1 hypothetical protein CLMAG_17230 [Clostridium magnum DSM 2767]SHH29879.1 hypothetical protein SAMN02745944_00508 [Clostridium magnum DSM 2767]
MKIDFSREQYRALIKLIYAGNILMNSFREKEEINKEYEELEYYVYSFAKQFNCETFIEYDNEFKEHFPTPQFDGYMRKKISDYENYVFWTKLLTEITDMGITKEFNKDIDNFNKALKVMCKLEKENSKILF